MTRPIYQTAANLSDEQSIAKAVEKAWGVKFHKNHEGYYRLDASIVDPETGRLFAMAEIKRRHHNYGTFGTIVLGLNKFKDGVEYQTQTGLEFYLFFGFDDGVYFYHYKPGDVFPVVWGGRTTNTRDEQDIGPTIHIPISRVLPIDEEKL